jgi:hypothetical protein
LRYFVAVADGKRLARCDAETARRPAVVAISSDGFSYAFGDPVKCLRLTPEPKRVAIGIITRKGKLGPATEKFCQCAKEAFSTLR